MESVVLDLAYGTNTHLLVPKRDQKETPGSDWKDGLLYVALDAGLVSKGDYHAAMRDAQELARILAGLRSAVSRQICTAKVKEGGNART